MTLKENDMKKHIDLGSRGTVRCLGRFVLFSASTLFVLYSFNPSLMASQATASPTVRPPIEAPSDETAVVTKHQIMVDGKPLKYTARAGYLPIRDQFGDTKAQWFYIAYTAEETEKKGQRPVTFVWNGGPGAPSSPLHFQLLGPRRRLTEKESGSTSAYPVVDNNETLLRYTDLVMVDPVGSGYSYPVKPEYGSLFWGVQQDLDSVVEFIRIYLTHSGALGAPIFLVGESYGTFRAAGVAAKLVDKEYPLMGVVMISSLLNMKEEGGVNSLALALPSYTAAAFFHKKLPPDLQKDLGDTLRQAEEWAIGDYTVALMKGDRLGNAERETVAAKLARFTGLDKAFIEKNNLRVSVDQFGQQLLASEKKAIGHYDSRITAETKRSSYDVGDDPSLFARGRNPFLFTTYLRSELDIKIDRPYQGPFGGFWPPSKTPRGDWMAFRFDWGTPLDSKLDQSAALSGALRMKDDLRVMFVSGLYDLVTTYFVTDYDISQLSLDPKLRGHVEHKRYEGGHMIYEDNEARLKLIKDISAFVQGALAAEKKSLAEH
jgi:carboxypeptidase C (cathepsin A)